MVSDHGVSKGKVVTMVGTYLEGAAGGRELAVVTKGEGT